MVLFFHRLLPYFGAADLWWLVRRLHQRPRRQPKPVDSIRQVISLACPFGKISCLLNNLHFVRSVPACSDEVSQVPRLSRRRSRSRSIPLKVDRVHGETLRCPLRTASGGLFFSFCLRRQKRPKELLLWQVWGSWCCLLNYLPLDDL